MALSGVGGNAIYFGDIVDVYTVITSALVQGLQGNPPDNVKVIDRGIHGFLFIIDLHELAQRQTALEQLFSTGLL